MAIENQVDVILLAAGKGARLGKLTNGIPKSLLPISGKNSILDVYLDYFLPIDSIRRICIIGGYAFSALSDYLLDKWSFEIEHGRIVLLNNPIYASTNNIVTFVQSAPFFSSGGILIEADLICSPDIYMRVVKQARENPNQSFLVIDESSWDRSDAMRISKHPNGMISEIGKDIDLDISEGEFLGISYLTPKDAEIATEVCRTLISGGENHLFYEEGFAAATSKQILSLYSLPTEGSPWSEVDNFSDYQRAKDLLASFKK
jgi:choline kinase